MEEAKWMQADFKEGHKYKVATCTAIAQAMRDYWIYGEICCVKRKIVLTSKEDTLLSDGRVSEKSVRPSDISTNDSDINIAGKDDTEAAINVDNTTTKESAAATNYRNGNGNNEPRPRSKLA